MNSAVIGSGAWGHALAAAFGIDEIISARGAVQNISADYVFIATEAQKLREAITRHKIAENSIIIICSKGIEQDSLKLMGEVVEEVLPGNIYAVLSGPNFADEVKEQLPAATTIACKDAATGKKFVADFTMPNLRLYLTDDVISTQIGGAVKNVIAIAAGIAIGKNLGENARAAIITRGMAEIVRLAMAMGGRLETMMGLAGFGDMILTSTSNKSRNTAFGIELAQHRTSRHPALDAGSFEEIPHQVRDDGIERGNGVVEGYYTAKSVYDLAQKLNVEMPICFSVYEILYKGKDINEAVNDLLKRPQR